MQIETMCVSALPVGLKSERLPEFRRAIVSRMNGDDAAARPRMVEQCQGKHPADAAPAHCGTDIETPHPQRP